MKEGQTEQHILLTGNPVKVLLRYIMPIAFSLFLQSMYGITDLWIVTRYCGAESVLAVSSAAQVTSFFSMFITGMTAGAAVMMAGAKDFAEARETAASAVKLMLVLGSVLALLMYLGADHIVHFMQVREAAGEEMADYLQICSLGMLFTSIYQMVSGIYRSIGRSNIALLFAAAAGAANLLGDLVLVGLWDMGAFGAGAATMGAQGICVLLAMACLRKWPVSFLQAETAEDNGRKIVPGGGSREKAGEIIRLSSPIILNSLLTGISILVATSMINSVGTVEAAGVGIAEKMFTFFVLVPTAFQEGLGTYTALHVAAGNRRQAINGLWTAFACSLGFCTVISLCTYFGGDVLAGLFQAEPAVSAAAAAYLKGDSLEYIFLALTYCLQGYFNGLGKTRFVMLSAAAAAFLVRIPLICWLCAREPVSIEWIGWGMSLSAGVCTLFCLAYYKILLPDRNLRRQQN